MRSKNNRHWDSRQYELGLGLEVGRRAVEYLYRFRPERLGGELMVVAYEAWQRFYSPLSHSVNYGGGL